MKIDWAADPDDKDEVDIEPPARLRALHDALGSLGFDLKGASSVTASRTISGESREFVQEFEYRPVGTYRDDLEELEVFVSPGTDTTAVRLIVDLPDTVISERERHAELTITDEDTEEIAARIESAIERQLSDD